MAPVLDVQVVCQRSKLARPTEVPSFLEYTYDFGTDYAFAEQDAGVAPNYDAQFSSEPMAVTVQ